MRDLAGEKWTPALTVPQIREAFELLLHRALNCDTTERIARERNRKLIRNKLARL